jgi:hypothetical protein
MVVSIHRHNAGVGRLVLFLEVGKESGTIIISAIWNPVTLDKLEARSFSCKFAVSEMSCYICYIMKPSKMGKLRQR